MTLAKSSARADHWSGLLLLPTWLFTLRELGFKRESPKSQHCIKKKADTSISPKAWAQGFQKASSAIFCWSEQWQGQLILVQRENKLHLMWRVTCMTWHVFQEWHYWNLSLETSYHKLRKLQTLVQQIFIWTFTLYQVSL